MKSTVSRIGAAAAFALALAGASSVHASVYVDPTLGSAYNLFTSIDGSVSSDGWSGLNRVDLGFASSDTAGATQALVDGIQANVTGSGDGVLRRTQGTIYPSGSALYNAGNNNPHVLEIYDTTLSADLSSLVLQSYIALLQPNAYATAVLNINGGSQSLLASSVVSGTDAAYRTWTWDLSGLGQVDSYSLLVTVGGGAVQAWGFQVDQVAAAVPEPSTYAMVLSGVLLAGVAAARRQRRG